MPVSLVEHFGDAVLDEIVAAMDERRLTHLAGACDRPDELFSSEALEELLLCDGIEQSLSMWVNGRAADLDMMGAARKGRLRHLAVRKLARQGTSIILNELERYVPALWDLACDAERRFRDHVRVVSVASFTRIPALTAHYDPWDLILIQIEGIKTWRLFGEPVDCGVAKHAGVSVPEGVSATVTLNPGDVLFVPAGLHHQCESDAFSLHIGLVIERATLRDLLGDLLEAHVSLNRPLRAVVGPAALVAQFAAIRRELAARLDDVDAPAWLSGWNSRRARVTSLGLRGLAEDSADDAELTLAVTMVPGQANGGRLKVGGAELELTPGAVHVLRALMDGPRRLSDLLDGLATDDLRSDARAAVDLLAARGVVCRQPIAGKPQARSEVAAGTSI